MSNAGNFFLFMMLATMPVVVSCNKKSDEAALVARVGDKELTWEQLKSLIPDNSSVQDSAMLAESYISGWLKEQVVITKAELNLAPDQQNFDELMESYRKSLITYSYEQELIEQKLDTIISEQEILKYYNNNIENFQLKDYIVKVKFCAINSEHDQIKLLKKLFASQKPEDLVKWEQFCVENNATYYFREDEWLLLDELLMQVPLQVFDAEAFLKKNRNIEFEKDNNLYLLTITDYQLSGSASPLSFERNKIRSLILNFRKTELLSRMRDDLYSEALQKNEIEFFYKNKK
ncbi:MAG: peptidyl-prolyl cis-trans isomerase [Flavobacteriales bacterium]|nr:peptidyl-prolyl cis-trans isomerase [Flavobacteriales bacterium]